MIGGTSNFYADQPWEAPYCHACEDGSCQECQDFARESEWFSEPVQTRFFLGVVEVAANPLEVIA